MITEDYVSFEVAKLLKEKGFNEPIWTRYEDDNEVIFGDKYNWNNSPMGHTSAPTHQMAKKWLREEHNLYVEIFVTWRDKIPHYQWRINNLITQDTIVDTPCLEKPEEAVEAALKYTLENLI